MKKIVAILFLAVSFRLMADSSGGNAWNTSSGGVGAGTITGVTAGTGIAGGGSSGTVTVSADQTVVPLLSSTNAFTGGNTYSSYSTFTGSMTATNASNSFGGNGSKLTAISTTSLSASGTPSATTFLRGDNSWATPGGGGLTIGNAVTGGAANSVLFEDNQQNANVSSALTFSTSTQVLTATATVVSTGTLGAGGVLGSVSAPLLGFTGGTNATGFYNSGTVANPILSLTFKGTDGLDMNPATGVMNFPSAGGSINALQFQYGGLVGSPALRIGGNTTGLYSDASGHVGIIAVGGEVARFTTVGVNVGSAANPTQTLTVVGNASFSTGIVGSVLSDVAAAGAVGEPISVSSTSFVNAASSGTWTNIASVAVTAGDWDAEGCGAGKLNGATANDFEVVISSFSGNTTTDHVEGQNWSEGPAPLAGSPFKQTTCVPKYIIHLAATTTMYLKSLWAFTAGTPQAIGTMTFRRRR